MQFAPGFQPAPKDILGKTLWQIEHFGNIPYTPNKKVSQDRYIFVQSLGYDRLPHDATLADKISYIVIGILRCIPGVSLVIEAPNLFETIKNRVLYEMDKEKAYVYDARFSGWSILQSVVYALGLGILITPVRVAAEFMRFNDGWKDEFDNPHLLSPSELQFASWDKYSIKKKDLLKFFPGEEDFCCHVIVRKHHLYPDLLYNTLYPDNCPRKKNPELIKKFKNLLETNEEFRKLFCRKT